MKGFAVMKQLGRGGKEGTEKNGEYGGLGKFLERKFRGWEKEKRREG